MKRLVIIGAVVMTTLGGLVATAPVAEAQRGQRVFCQTTSHRVTCFNYTPYRVYMHVRVYTSAGTYHWFPVNRHTRITHFYGPTIYRVRWSWHY